LTKLNLKQDKLRTWENWNQFYFGKIWFSY